MDQNEPNFNRYKDNCRYCSFLERVANFNLNFFGHFSINFENSCAHYAANFLNLSKHTQLLHFGCIWRKLWLLNKKKMFLKMRFSWVFFLNCHNFFQMHPMCKIWVCFDKFRKFAAKWAQEFSKLIEKWLRKLRLKLATPSRKEEYLQLSVYLSKLGSFWFILDREQNVVAGGIWFCIPKWTLCRWVCTSQLWYYEILKCNERWLDLDRFSWWPCSSKSNL